MSYCRFSSDDWKSDVYVYADSSGGWIVHVAGNRPSGPIPTVDHSLLASGCDDDLAKYVEAFNAQTTAVSASVRTPIDHPEACATRNFPSPGEAAEYLDRLSREGFHVPHHVVPELRDEQATFQ